MDEAHLKTREDYLELLREERERWEALLAGLSEAQISAPELPGGRSIKDVIAHLAAWQQITNARLTAVREQAEPKYPAWLGELDFESEEDLDEINDLIFAAYRDQPWAAVHHNWRAGYQRVLDSAGAIPEDDLLARGRYAWLEDYSLGDVLLGTYRHHHEEHLGPLLNWLREHGWLHEHGWGDTA